MTFILPKKDPNLLPEGNYRTDVFNLKRYFYIKNKNQEVNSNYLVSSWNEAYSLHGDAHFEDINNDYLKTIILDRPNSNISPYKRIKCIPRCSDFFYQSNDEIKTQIYQPFKSNKLNYNNQNLTKFVSKVVSNNLSNALNNINLPVGIEHSSGLDSNALLGCLIFKLGIDKNKIYTWSHEGGGEKILLKEFRKFFNLNLNNCEKFIPEVNKDKIKDNSDFIVNLFGAPTQFEANLLSINSFFDAGCKVMISGLGGDQGLSFNGYNIKSEYLANLEIGKLINHFGGLLSFGNYLSGRCFHKINSFYKNLSIFFYKDYRYKKNILFESLTDEGKVWLKINKFQDEKYKSNDVGGFYEILLKNIMAEWIPVRLEEEMRLAEAYGIKKLFPMLDEYLLSIVLKQDPKEFCDKYNNGRLIVRNSFKNYLPSFFQNTDTKFRSQFIENIGANNYKLKKYYMKELSKDLDSLLNIEKSLRKYWDLDILEKETNNLLNKYKGNSLEHYVNFHLSFNKLRQINAWFKKF